MARQGGFGIKCKITVSATLTAITHILDAKFPKQEKILWEATGHDSTSGYVEHLATGVRQLSEFSLTLAWDDTETTHAALVTAFDSNAAVAMSIEDPGGAEVIAFSAHIKDLGRVSEIKGGYKCEVTIQPTGAPTIS